MAFPETIKAFFSSIILSFAFWVISKISQIRERMNSPPSSQAVVVPQQNYNHFQDQWKTVVMAFCFEAAFQIALLSAQTQLAVSFHILSFAILLIFLALFVSSFIGTNFTSGAPVFELALGILVITTVVFAITVPFPLSLKCVTWALFAISLITILICRASSFRSVRAR